MKISTKNQFAASLLTAIGTLALGILFTAKPNILSTICLYAGIIACIAAAGLVIAYFVKKRENSGLMVYGIIAAVVGILLIILPGLLKFLIPIFFGAWILVNSASGMYRNFSFRHDHHFWWIGFILCTIGAVIGAYVITRPMEIMDTTVRLIGIALIIFAVLRIVSVFMARHYFTPPTTGNVIDVTLNKD